MCSDVPIFALVSSCYSCWFNSLFISSRKKAPRPVWLTVLSPAPSMVPGPGKIPEYSLSNECMRAAPDGVSSTLALQRLESWPSTL